MAFWPQLVENTYIDTNGYTPQKNGLGISGFYLVGHGGGGVVNWGMGIMGD